MTVDPSFLAIDWGDTPAWVTAISTFGLMVFAVVAAYFARKAYLRETEAHAWEEDSLRSAQAESRQRQASQVAAWIGHPDGDSPMLMMRNSSQSPVYRCDVVVFSPQVGDAEVKHHLEVLPPDTQPKALALDDLSTSTLPEAGSRLQEFRTRMVFSDASGIRWVRNQDGRLAELGPTFTIWSDDRFVARLHQFAERFFGDYDVKPIGHSTLESEDLRKQLATVEAGEALPEVIVGPHDWLGELVDRGQVSQVGLTSEERRRFSERSLNALTFDGRLYGLPHSWDTVALLRNAALAPEAPLTLLDAISEGEELVDRGLAKFPLLVPIGPSGDPYHFYALLSSAGGRLFDSLPDGALDLSSVAVTTVESLTAAQEVAQIAQRCRWNQKMGSQEVVEEFLTGKSAYLIATSGALLRARESGLDCRVSAIPPLRLGAAYDARPLVTVGAFFFPSGAANGLLGQDYVADYLSHFHADLDLSGGLTTGSGPHDEEIKVFLDECKRGHLMPAVPEMPQVWRLLAEAELQILRDPSADKVDRVVKSLGRDLTALVSRERQQG